MMTRIFFELFIYHSYALIAHIQQLTRYERMYQTLFIMNNLMRNSVQLIGNIGSEIKLTKTKSGTSVLNLSLATNEYYTTNKGERTKQTQWHRLVAWGKQAEFMADMLYKGCEVGVRGKLSYNSYENAEGETKYYTEIRVLEFMKISKEVVEKEEAPF